jgi:cytochrome c peroxidase
MQVYNTIAEIIDDAGDYDGKQQRVGVSDKRSRDQPDGSYGPVLVRLAWHASGTYDKETGTGGR